MEHPVWSRSATLYQLNTRQFTTEGSLAAAEAHLPRLKELGADIIWLMPIHPIGERNRKGRLGSPYAVQDHRTVNPELGTLSDLKRFVETAHAQGLRVILDWVGNHTAWDHALVAQHPEWYARDGQGRLRPTPWCDWSDVIDLDYGQDGLRRYMTEAMTYWVAEAGIDGYRCDVAGFVPVDFWNGVRRELEAIKPVFLLAEWESRDLHAEAFDATYAWSWYNAVRDVAQGRADLTPLLAYYAANQGAFPRGAMRMIFVTNHDKNAWEGTEFEHFGPALDAAIVLSVVGDGIPLIYCGQEAGNTRRLAFFEKDPIEWRDHSQGELYRKLFALKKRNTALWNGHWGAPMTRVLNHAPTSVLSFVRSNETDAAFAVFNFSAHPRTVTFDHTLHDGRYRDYFRGSRIEFGAASRLALEPWGYRVFVR